MQVGLKIENRGAFLKLATDAARLDEDIKQVIRATTREYFNIVRGMLGRAPMGRVYRKGSQRRAFVTVREKVTLFGGTKRTVKRRARAFGPFAQTYRASRPGDPPASFTGNMADSLSARFGLAGGYGGRVKVGRFKHRHLLEFGTQERFQRTSRGKPLAKPRSTGRVAKRPLWSPTQERALDDLQRRLLRAIDLNLALGASA